jgi:hypothetical protein
MATKTKEVKKEVKVNKYFEPFNEQGGCSEHTVSIKAGKDGYVNLKLQAFWNKKNRTLSWNIKLGDTGKELRAYGGLKNLGICRLTKPIPVFENKDVTGEKITVE